MNKLMEALKPVVVLEPSADLYDGNPTSATIRLGKDYDRVVFLLSQVTSTSNTGKATVTVKACSDAAGNDATAIAFDYYKNESSESYDDFGARQAATDQGFSTTANKHALYAIEVRANELPAGKPWVQIKCTEAVDDPVVGCAIAIVGDGAQGNPDTLPTAIA